MWHRVQFAWVDVLGATAGLPSSVASGGGSALLDKPAVAPEASTGIASGTLWQPGNDGYFGE